MLDDAYNARMLALAGETPPSAPLDRSMSGPVGAATRHARMCGSRLSAEIRLLDGRVAEHAQTIEACALGRASAAIVAHNAVGADIAELRAARDLAAATLETGALPDSARQGFALPAGKWEDIALLGTLKDFRARHGSVMLAFEAAFEAALEAASLATGDASSET